LLSLLFDKWLREKSAEWLRNAVDAITPAGKSAQARSASPPPTIKFTSIPNPPPAQRQSTSPSVEAPQSPNPPRAERQPASAPKRVANDMPRKSFEASQSYSAELNCLVLDLHGCLTVEARSALSQKLDECYDNGVRFMEVVYGRSGRKVAGTVRRFLTSESISSRVIAIKYVKLDHAWLVGSSDASTSTGVLLVVAMNPRRVTMIGGPYVNQPNLPAHFPDSRMAKEISFPRSMQPIAQSYPEAHASIRWKSGSKNSVK
jgi:DNA-nicking Smr family endonuclease